MSVTLYDRKVKIRKPHKCFSCMRVLPVGVTMHKWVGIYEGDFGQVYYCTVCEEIMNLFPCEPGEGWPEGFTTGFYAQEVNTPEKVLELAKCGKL